MRKTTRLREMLNAGKTQLVPGVYDGLSARIAQAAGADLLYATGGGIARSTGIPDMGLINPVQITERLEQIVDAVDLPVIADFDTGYGNALNALHTLKGFERVVWPGSISKTKSFRSVAVTSRVKPSCPRKNLQ